MLRTWLCQVDVTVQIKPVDPILIRSGYATVDGADMVPVCTYRGEEPVYFLPGTSLKGVLRSHLERVARTLKPQSVCIPYFDPKKEGDIPIPVPSETRSHGCGYRSRGGGKDPSAAAYSDSCAACRLFGSLKFAGRFSIGDAYPIAGHAPAREQRNGVGIDRFTGGTVPGLLFDLQVLVGGVFETRIRIDNFELWQLAALNLLLTDLDAELVHIGSGRSRSLGRIKGEVTAYHLSYIRPVSHAEGIFGLATPEDQREYGLHSWAAQPPIALASPVAFGLRQEYDLTSDWSTRLAPLIPSFEHFLLWHGGPKGSAGKAKQEGVAKA